MGKQMQTGDKLYWTREFSDYVFRYVKMPGLGWRMLFEGRSWALKNATTFGAFINCDDVVIYIPRDIAEGMKP